MLLALALTGCGEGGSDTPPTRIPTQIPPTPTPRSSPLPEVSPAPLLGDRARPLEIQFVGDPSDNDARDVASELQLHLEESVTQDGIGLSFTVQIVSETDALNAVCSGAPAAAWISAFSYASANERCGAIPVYAVTRQRAQRAHIGTTVEIVARAGFSSIGQLQQQVFCRSDEQDTVIRWVLPALILASQGIDPITGLSEIKDYPDDMALGRALYEGDCAAAALPAGEYDDWLDDLERTLSTSEEPVERDTLADMLQIISPAGDTVLSTNNASRVTRYDANVIPYEVLVFPPDSAFPADQREQTADAIHEFFTERGSSTQRLHDLLDADGIVQVDNNAFTAFRTMLVQGRWNMTD
ncbi:MAG: PhnD/SsuA/transferrin family substrate-binding protein [Anaerolineae bacterium]|nr:PhnD/SsuA/transferrin family substrate-binding protein [Anaerolineae bacterium]